MNGVTYTLNELAVGYRVQKHDKVLAHSITAQLPEGQLTCLLAKNGAGKSTLLRTLAGFMQPLQGEIRLADRCLSDYSPAEIARNIGVVLTDKIQDGNLTAFELVAMGRLPYTNYFGSLSEKDRSIIDDAMQQVGMQSFADRKLSSLSDGELQKLVIAKTLAQETAVILLDEPLAFLDFPSKIGMLQLLHGLSREVGKTILLSIHDLEIALQAADNLWIINPEGKMEYGTPKDLSEKGSLDFFFSDKNVRFNRENFQYSFIN